MLLVIGAEDVEDNRLPDCHKVVLAEVVE